jgi:hypothetical protein
MISGTLNVEELQLFSHGRVSGCYAKNLLFNCGVMDERAEEESLAITGNGEPVTGNAGTEVSNYKFSNAARTKLQKFCTVWKSNRICNTKCCSGKKYIKYIK